MTDKRYVARYIPSETFRQFTIDPNKTKDAALQARVNGELWFNKWKSQFDDRENLVFALEKGEVFTEEDIEILKQYTENPIVLLYDKILKSADERLKEFRAASKKIDGAGNGDKEEDEEDEEEDEEDNDKKKKKGNRKGAKKGKAKSEDNGLLTSLHALPIIKPVDSPEVRQANAEKNDDMIFSDMNTDPLKDLSENIQYMYTTMCAFGKINPEEGQDPRLSDKVEFRFSENKDTHVITVSIYDAVGTGYSLVEDSRFEEFSLEDSSNVDFVKGLLGEYVNHYIKLTEIEEFKDEKKKNRQTLQYSYLVAEAVIVDSISPPLASFFDYMIMSLDVDSIRDTIRRFITSYEKRDGKRDDKIKEMLRDDEKNNLALGFPFFLKEFLLKLIEKIISIPSVASLIPYTGNEFNENVNKVADQVINPIVLLSNNEPGSEWFSTAKLRRSVYYFVQNQAIKNELLKAVSTKNSKLQEAYEKRLKGVISILSENDAIIDHVARSVDNQNRRVNSTSANKKFRGTDSMLNSLISLLHIKKYFDMQEAETDNVVKDSQSLSDDEDEDKDEDGKSQEDKDILKFLNENKDKIETSKRLIVLVNNIANCKTKKELDELNVESVLSKYFKDNEDLYSGIIRFKEYRDNVDFVAVSEQLELNMTFRHYKERLRFVVPGEYWEEYYDQQMYEIKLSAQNKEDEESAKDDMGEELEEEEDDEEAAIKTANMRRLEFTISIVNLKQDDEVKINVAAETAWSRILLPIVNGESNESFDDARASFDGDMSTANFDSGIVYKGTNGTDEKIMNVFDALCLSKNFDASFARHVFESVFPYSSEENQTAQKPTVQLKKAFRLLTEQPDPEHICKFVALVLDYFDVRTEETDSEFLHVPEDQNDDPLAVINGLFTDSVLAYVIRETRGKSIRNVLLLVHDIVSGTIQNAGIDYSARNSPYFKITAMDYTIYAGNIELFDHIYDLCRHRIIPGMHTNAYNPQRIDPNTQTTTYNPSYASPFSFLFLGMSYNKETYSKSVDIATDIYEKLESLMTANQQDTAWWLFTYEGVDKLQSETTDHAKYPVPWMVAMACLFNDKETYTPDLEKLKRLTYFDEAEEEENDDDMQEIDTNDKNPSKFQEKRKIDKDSYLNDDMQVDEEAVEEEADEQEYVIKVGDFLNFFFDRVSYLLKDINVINRSKFSFTEKQYGYPGWYHYLELVYRFLPVEYALEHVIYISSRFVIGHARAYRAFNNQNTETPTLLHLAALKGDMASFNSFAVYAGNGLNIDLYSATHGTVLSCAMDNLTSDNFTKKLEIAKLAVRLGARLGLVKTGKDANQYDHKKVAHLYNLFSNNNITEKMAISFAVGVINEFVASSANGTIYLYDTSSSDKTKPPSLFSNIEDVSEEVSEKQNKTNLIKMPDNSSVAKAIFRPTHLLNFASKFDIQSDEENIARFSTAPRVLGPRKNTKVFKPPANSPIGDPYAGTHVPAAPQEKKQEVIELSDSDIEAQSKKSQDDMQDDESNNAAADELKQMVSNQMDVDSEADNDSESDSGSGSDDFKDIIRSLKNKKADNVKNTESMHVFDAVEAKPASSSNDSYTATPLYACIKENKLEILKWAIAQCNNPSPALNYKIQGIINTKNMLVSFTLLEYAHFLQRSNDIKDVLIQAGAKEDDVNKFGYTALEFGTLHTK